MKAILLINTGSPQTYKRRDVKAFIVEMLLDPQVMTVADWVRPILVKGIIAPLRQFASSRRYARIWGEGEKYSPILRYGKGLADKLEAMCGVSVHVAMRYGEPNIKRVLKSLAKDVAELEEVIVLPLYAQYATSSYQTIVDAVNGCIDSEKMDLKLRIIAPYFSHSAYINALTSSIEPYIKEEFDSIIFNFHSLPLSHVEEAWEKGKEFDYVFQGKETIRLVSNKLGIEPKYVRLSYSSAMGRNWLKPSLKDILKSVAADGKRRVVVIAPGFAADNLETLYDIDIVARNYFLKMGGTKFTYIPSLNAGDEWVKAITEIIE